MCEPYREFARNTRRFHRNRRCRTEKRAFPQVPEENAEQRGCMSPCHTKSRRILRRPHSLAWQSSMQREPMWQEPTLQAPTHQHLRPGHFRHLLPLRHPPTAPIPHPRHPNRKKSQSAPQHQTFRVAAHQPPTWCFRFCCSQP